MPGFLLVKNKDLAAEGQDSVHVFVFYAVGSGQPCARGCDPLPNTAEQG